MNTVSDETRGSIRELAGVAVNAIDRCMTEIRTIRDRVAALSTDTDTDRLRIQHEREERELLLMLEIELPDDTTAGNDTAQLSDRETELAKELRKVRAFERGLADFASVLVAARRQMESGGRPPDAAIANDLAIKMAQLRAREEERQRFARDVHDGPAQAFANAIIGLEFIERALRTDRDNVIEDGLAEIERIKRTMREGLTEIRRFIFDHRPTMLLDRGLAPTLRHYVQSYQSIFPMVVNVDIDADIDRFDPDLELTAFRVVQESIQNASKHAKASQVDVRIRRAADNSVLVTIVDDGRGFDPERVSAHAMGGVGLNGMKERVALVGGQLTIDSERGAGTTVQLVLPAEGRAPEDA